MYISMIIDAYVCVHILFLALRAVASFVIEQFEAALSRLCFIQAKFIVSTPLVYISGVLPTLSYNR